MPDAEVFYLRHLPLPKSPDEVMQELINETSWRAEKVTVWGKQHLQPRLISWFGDSGNRYSYSGVVLDPQPWTPLLRELKTAVEQISDEQFNSVLLNYYRDHRDSMGFHSDDEPELGAKPIIASVSLGATRTFIMKHKTNKFLRQVRIPLESGSLLVMKGDTQRNWKHGTDKETRPCGPRVNLTFHRITRFISVRC